MHICCRLVLIEACGHCIHLEKPAEMAKHIIDFTSQVQLSTSDRHERTSKS
jgi:pimeloyl-ACP methyl ester carboxylesterase